MLCRRVGAAGFTANVSYKALSFCCTSTVFLSKTVPFHVVRLSQVGEAGKKLDVEDSSTAAFRLDNGTLGVITSGYYTDVGYNSHLKLWGSKGWIDMEVHVPIRWPRLHFADPASPFLSRQMTLLKKRGCSKSCT
eukprot:SAG22_NODE_73_length_22318_cov_47.105315_16_plen_135_part_00